MKKSLKNLFFFVIFSVFAATFSLFAINHALKNENFRNNLLHIVASSLQGELQADQLAISFDKKSINVTGNNLKGSLLNNSLLIDIPDTRIKITYAELLQGSFYPSTFQADSPLLSFSPQHAENNSPELLSWSDTLNSLLKKIAGKGVHFNLTNGTFKQSSTTLSKLSIKTVPDKEITELNLRTEILFKNYTIPLQLSGSADNSLTKGFTYSFKVNAQSIPFDLIPKNRDFFFSKGTTDFTGTLTGKKNSVNLGGHLDVHDMAMTVGWTSEDKKLHQEKPYNIKKIGLDLHGNLQDRKINFSALDLQSDDFHVVGSLVLDFTSLTNPFMDLRFITDQMEVTTLKQLLPDPLINDWTTRTIFPRLENGTAQITSFILAGTIDEISWMSEPENNHCLAWSGILKNVDTFYNDHKELGKVHTAELSMDGDLLTIKNVSGKSGKSLLATANVSISHLYDDSSLLTTDIEGSFDLPWLTKIFKSGVAGKELEMMTVPITSISGQADGTVGFTLELLSDDVTLKKLSGEGSASGPLDLQFKNLLPVHMKTTDFILDYPGTCTISGKGLWGKSIFNGKLNLIDLDRKQKFKVTFHPDLSEIKNIFNDNLIINSLAPCVTSVPVAADILFENGNIYAKGNVDFSQFEINNKENICQQMAADSKLLESSFDIKYNQKVLNIKNFSLLATGGSLNIQGEFIPNQQNKSLFQYISVQAASFPVSSLSLLVPGNKTFLTSGILDADIRTITPVDEHYWSSFAGNFYLDGWQGSLKNPALTVDNVDIRGSFEQGLFHLQGEDLRFAKFNPEYPITFIADLEKNDLWKGSLRLYGDYFDLTSSPSLFREGKTDFKHDYPFDSLEIFAETGHLRYRNLIFSPLLLKGRITKNRIIISNILLEHGNDLMWLTGSLSGDDVVYESYFKLRETPVNPFMALLGFESKSITGSLDMEGKLTSKVTPGSTIFETSKGPFSFEVKKGSVVSSSSLIKILDLISLENIFDKQDVLKWKNSFNFNVIQGRFDLSDGIFTTDSFVMDASAFDIFGQGKIDGLQESIDMEVKIAPFGTVDKIIRSIPYLGFVLTGKSKSLFDYSLSVKGKIEDPDVHYVPLKDTFKSLTGYIKRLVTVREDVQKEINTQLKEDMNRKNNFILLMKTKLAPLHD